jgi:hypothetical protein
MQMILAPSVQAPPLPLLLNLLVRPLSQVQGLLPPVPLPVTGPLKEAPALVKHPSKCHHWLQFFTQHTRRYWEPLYQWRDL